MFNNKIIFIATLLIGVNSFSQDLTVTIGQSSKINIPILNVTNTDKCHIEVSMPNQQKIAIDVSGPEFVASFDYTPIQSGVNTFRWEGKLKRRGLNSVFACPGSGSLQVQVNETSEQITKKWEEYFSRSTEEAAECVKYGMDTANLKYQILADPNLILTGPDDSKVKPIFEKCESFLRQNQPKKGVACTLANQNNLRTTCDGVYAERQPDGKLRTISRRAAIQLHFEGKPWTVGVIENSEVRNNRLKQEEVDRQRQAADAAAKREAEEKERRFKESPEYKKQQAELERKRLAEERAAEENAKRERERLEAAERQRKAEDQRRQKEAEERQRIERAEFAKNFPFIAIITCGFQNQHMNIIPCFAGRVGTELELRNGSDYNMYQVQDLMMGRPGTDTRDGYIINLRRNFSLKVQNSDDTLILGVKIVNRMTNETVFEKKVARFGVVSIKN